MRVRGLIHGPVPTPTRLDGSAVLSGACFGARELALPALPCHGRCPLTHQPSNRLTTHRPNNRPHHLPAEPPPHLRKPPFHLPSRQDGPGPAHPGHAARARNPAARARARHCATTRRPARCASAGAKAASGAAAPRWLPLPPRALHPCFIVIGRDLITPRDSGRPRTALPKYSLVSGRDTFTPFDLGLAVAVRHIPDARDVRGPRHSRNPPFGASAQRARLPCGAAFPGAALRLHAAEQ